MSAKRLLNYKLFHADIVTFLSHDILMSFIFAFIGTAILLISWHFGINYLVNHHDLSGFSGFAPNEAFAALHYLLKSGEAWDAAYPSLLRIISGLTIAFVIGVPIGIFMGLLPILEKMVNFPFQIIRMISPLSWMPIAILIFATWDGAIVFLIATAAIWPIIFTVAASVKRIDPAWMVVAKAHGGKHYNLIHYIVLPAILPDMMVALRLALGTAWVILVPAEFLGVTSGLGYAINDARDTLSYDLLAGLVLLIGFIGFALDYLLKRIGMSVSWTATT